MVVELTDSNYDAEVASSAVPCVIGFTAGWCTMCDSLVPIFESLSGKFGNKVKFCIANIDRQKALRIKFAVAMLPYVVYVEGSKKTPLFDEVVTERRLEERVQFMLDGGIPPV